MHEVGIAVRRAEATKNSDAFSGSLLRLVDVLVEVIINVPRAFLAFESSVLEDEARVLVDRRKFPVRENRAEKLMSGQTEKVRSHLPLAGKGQIVVVQVIEAAGAGFAGR